MLERSELRNMHSTIKLATDLQHIQDRGKVGHTVVPWVYTNDFGLGQKLSQVPPEHLHTEDNLRVYLILGTGGLFSAAAHFKNHFDVLLIVDNNSFVLDWMKISTDLLQKNATPQAFEKALKEHELWQETHAALSGSGNSLHDWKAIEQQALGDRHFLASQENYEAAQRALKGKTLLFSTGNMLHDPYVTGLTTALQANDAIITCASVTDTADWHEGFAKNFQRLPFSHDAFVYWSTNKDSENGHPKAQTSLGIHEYVQEATTRRLQTSYQLLDPTQA